MSREQAIQRAEKYFDSGEFFTDLARRVAIPTESQNPDRAGALADYLSAELVPSLHVLGFVCEIFKNPNGGPFHRRSGRLQLRQAPITGSRKRNGKQTIGHRLDSLFPGYAFTLHVHGGLLLDGLLQ